MDTMLKCNLFKMALLAALCGGVVTADSIKPQAKCPHSCANAPVSCIYDKEQASCDGCEGKVCWGTMCANIGGKWVWVSPWCSIPSEDGLGYGNPFN